MPRFEEQVTQFAMGDAAQAGLMRISIVCYESGETQLKKTLASLLKACALPLQKKLINTIEIVFVDNGPAQTERKKIEELLNFAREKICDGVLLSVIGNGLNLGFGAAHNLTFRGDVDGFHLVLNPDVEIMPESLSDALQFMAANPHCGIMVPAIFDGNGNREYLCKRYPTVFDLLIRGFAPEWGRKFFRARLAKYEMRDLIGEKIVWNPPIVSGCFMLIRTPVLHQLKGFDPNYFLYFEDFDLSLRAAAMTHIAYTPHIKIIHHGGYAAQKGLRHIFLFVRSAITFFSTHGWKWY